MTPSPLVPFEWMRLVQTRRAAEQARREVRRQGSEAVHRDARIATLEAALERSMSMNLALWEIMSEKFDLKSEVLEAKLAEIELRTSGGQPGQAQTCMACGRPNNATRVRCVYCEDFIAPRAESSFDTEDEEG